MFLERDASQTASVAGAYAPAALPGPAAGGLRARLRRAKCAYTTRRVELARAERLRDDVRPRPGDLVLARVARLGQHTRIELASGRRARLHPGDEVVVCFGARYAPDQFEAYVPDDLGPCSLVAAGGIAARCASRHARMKRATALEPVGVLARADGAPLNLAEFAIAEPARPTRRAPVLAVLGTAMNAGKTTTATALVRGFVGAGWQVAAAKVTGTGAGGDRWSVTDAGAHPVLDFTDAGVPSTFGLGTARVAEVFATLLDALQASSPDVIVLEVADGLLHEETAALIGSDRFRAEVDGVLFAAGDALGAKSGVEHLRALGLSVVGVSGLLTASPLAVREAEQATGVRVVTAEELQGGTGLAAFGWPLARAGASAAA